MTIKAGRLRTDNNETKDMLWEWQDQDYLITISDGTYDSSDASVEWVIEADTLLAVAAAVEKQKNIWERKQVVEDRTPINPQPNPNTPLTAADGSIYVPRTGKKYKNYEEYLGDII